MKDGYVFTGVNSSKSSFASNDLRPIAMSLVSAFIIHSSQYAPTCACRKVRMGAPLLVNAPIQYFGYVDEREAI